MTILKINDDALNKKIQKQILKNNAIQFSSEVEELVWMKDITYMEAIEIITKERDYEPEYTAKLITPELKSKLSKELEKLSLIKKTKRIDI